LGLRVLITGRVGQCPPSGPQFACLNNHDVNANTGAANGDYPNWELGTHGPHLPTKCLTGRKIRRNGGDVNSATAAIQTQG